MVNYFVKDRRFGGSRGMIGRVDFSLSMDVYLWEKEEKKAKGSLELS